MTARHRARLKRRTYKPTPTLLAALPFARGPSRKKVGARWCPPPAESWEAASAIGREYAGHFLQWLKDNPSMSGSNSLGLIASDIDFMDDSDARGYQFGFFAHLEAVLLEAAKRMDVFAHVERENAYYAKVMARVNALQEGID